MTRRLRVPKFFMEKMTRDTVRAALPFIDSLPYPVLWIDADYTVRHVNTTAETVYGSNHGTCHGLSHGYSHPCHLENEACPKLQAERTGMPVAVAHAHVTEGGNQLYKVAAIPVAGGGVVEFHIELTDIVSRDALTGLVARPFFEQMIRRELSLLGRMQIPYAMVFVDLDHFKRINDAHGHEAGDAALRAVGMSIGTCLRDSDLAGRWGGEELCVFLPGSDEDGAYLVAKRIQDAIRDIRLETPFSNLRVTASFGVFSSADVYNVDEAIRRADQAMYFAKESGRDRVERASVAPPPKHSE